MVVYTVSRLRQGDVRMHVFWDFRVDCTAGRLRLNDVEVYAFCNRLSPTSWASRYMRVDCTVGRLQLTRLQFRR